MDIVTKAQILQSKWPDRTRLRNETAAKAPPIRTEVVNLKPLNDQEQRCLQGKDNKPRIVNFDMTQNSHEIKWVEPSRLKSGSFVCQPTKISLINKWIINLHVNLPTRNEPNSFNKMIGLNWIIYNPYMIHWNKNNSKYIWRSTSFLCFFFLKRGVQLLKWVELCIIISRFHKSFQLNVLNGSSNDFFNDINRQSNST